MSDRKGDRKSRGDPVPGGVRTVVAQRPSTTGAWAAATIVIVISILSTFTLSKPQDGSRVGSAQRPSSYLFDTGTQGAGDGLGVAGDQPGGTGASGSGPGAAATGGPTAGRSAAGGGASAGAGPSSGGTSGRGESVRQADRNYDCTKGQNAGATDWGVSSNEIKFAATVVQTGIAKDFLSDAVFGIEAVRRKVNRAGGICGRLITIKYDDDGWDPARGEQIIEKYIGEQKYLGLAVNPSSEGLRFPIKNKLLDNNQFPVIGADGMLIGQYQDPWVWPIATSTHSVMHIMAKDALARGAKTFGIVWEGNYRFGQEGEAAFVGWVKRHGGSVVVDTKIQGGLTSYKNDADSFVTSCSQSGQDLKKCDFIALLLEPGTASQWVRDGGLGNGDPKTDPNDSSRTINVPAFGIGAPQPLFINSFARDCGKYCANMRVWTSFKPPLSPFDTDPAVANYRADLASVSSSADANNPHVEGAYVGMLLVKEALEKLGPAPTRQRLKEVLDQTVLDTGLAPALKFNGSNHFAATTAQAFEAVYNSGSFTQWRYTDSGFIPDEEVGNPADIPKEG